MNIFAKVRDFFYSQFYWLRKPKIRVNHAALSGDGSFIDIRYWISRPDKVNPNGVIFLVCDDGVTRLFLARIARFGYIRTRHNKFNHSGTLLFYNRYGLIQPGATVTLHLDNLVAEDIRVL